MKNFLEIQHGDGGHLLHKTIEEIYRYPLRQAATDTLNRQLRGGITDAELAGLTITLREEDRLCIIHETDGEIQEPQLICSMGLINSEGAGNA